MPVGMTTETSFTRFQILMTNCVTHLQAFGSLLLLVGKVHFNYIYGIGVLGCLAMYVRP